MKKKFAPTILIVTLIVSGCGSGSQGLVENSPSRNLEIMDKPISFECLKNALYFSLDVVNRSSIKLNNENLPEFHIEVILHNENGVGKSNQPQVVVSQDGIPVGQTGQIAVGFPAFFYENDFIWDLLEVIVNGEVVLTKSIKITPRICT